LTGLTMMVWVGIVEFERVVGIDTSSANAYDEAGWEYEDELIVTDEISKIIRNTQINLLVKIFVSILSLKFISP
jgi:hypothetical protein